MAIEYKAILNFYRAFAGFGIYVVFRLCRSCVAVSNNTIIKLVENGQSTGKTAQRGRILWKRKHFAMAETSPKDFICFFTECVQTGCVLQPNVSLYALTNEEAIFVETEENVGIYRSNVNPFFFMAQFGYSKNVMRMSITRFVELAERIGDPAIPVICVSNTGRCGGTMLVQMFESVPRMLVLNERHPLMNLCHLRQNGALSDSQYDAVLT